MNPQAYIHEAVRFIIVVGCAWFILFALEMSSPDPVKPSMCDVHHATDCYNRLAARR